MWSVFLLHVPKLLICYLKIVIRKKDSIPVVNDLNHYNNTTITLYTGQDVTIPVSSIQSQSELPSGACVLLSLSTGEPTLTSADCTRTFWMYGYICQYGTYDDMKTLDV